MNCFFIKIFLLADLLLVEFLLLDKVIHTVKSDSSVVTDDSAAGISIRKTCKNTCVTSFLHCVCISSEYAGVVCSSVCEFVLNLVRKLIAVCVTSLNSVSEACERRYTSLKRLICLKADDNVCVLVNYIACIVRKD